MQYQINESIDNFYQYKLFFLDIAPFDLNLDGNFCDEFYKYTLDILSNTNRIVSNSIVILLVIIIVRCNECI